MKVFINPGHDKKYDPGAVNRNLNLREADAAAEISGEVKNFLLAAGCEVKLMQSDNLWGDTDYPERRGLSVCQAANGWPADVFVSIHCNAFNGKAKGIETWCYALGTDGEKLAESIQGQLVSEIPDTPDRGVKANAHYGVLKSTAMPAVIVECGFIDNDDDAAMLTKKKYEIARAIARGVTDYELWRNRQNGVRL